MYLSVLIKLNDRFVCLDNFMAIAKYLSILERFVQV